MQWICLVHLLAVFSVHALPNIPKELEDVVLQVNARSGGKDLPMNDRNKRDVSEREHTADDAPHSIKKRSAASAGGDTKASHSGMDLDVNVDVDVKGPLGSVNVDVDVDVEVGDVKKPGATSTTRPILTGVTSDPPERTSDPQISTTHDMSGHSSSPMTTATHQSSPHSASHSSQNPSTSPQSSDASTPLPSTADSPATTKPTTGISETTTEDPTTQKTGESSTETPTRSPTTTTVQPTTTEAQSSTTTAMPTTTSSMTTTSSQPATTTAQPTTTTAQPTTTTAQTTTTTAQPTTTTAQPSTSTEPPTTTTSTTTTTTAQTTTTATPCDYSQFGSGHTMLLTPPSSGCTPTLSGVTEADKTIILQTHNNHRVTVAIGNETRGSPGPQPAGADIREMVWNDELAKVAQKWAEQCPNGHDTYDNRKICSRSYSVGQNIYYYWGFAASTAWKAAIDAWYEEVVDMPNTMVAGFTSGSANGKVIGHYTQVLWAKTNEVGCGGIHYSTDINGQNYPHSKIYVCNYGPAGNFLNQPIYTAGPAASQCTNGVSTTYSDLCA